MRRQYFITAQELRTCQEEVVLIDCDLQAAYDRLHLPNAHSSPCRYWKGAGSDEGLYGIEDPQRMSELIKNWGMNAESRVVGYDSSGGLNAARLGWTLERFGFTNFQVLDGGINGWVEAGYPLTQELPVSRTSQFVPQRPTTFNLCKIHQISQKVDDGTILWDDRSDREWDAGRIPGAVHLEWSEVLTDSGALKPDSVLRELLERVSVTSDSAICIYCQGGIRAAHSYWVLKHLGFERVTVFDGSWAEYSQSGLPVQS